VVIGIIAVLIGLLLPTLRKARESANRTVCLSNMRELANCFRVYAATYHDYCPIGFMDHKVLSYIVHWNNNTSTKPRWSEMGLVWEAGVVKNPKFFFCPSEPETKFQYLPNPPGGWSENPWPPNPSKSIPQDGHTKLGYNARPWCNWPASDYPTKGTAITDWGDKNAWLPSSGKGTAITLPRLAQLKNYALLADLVVDRSFVTRRHKTGINVLYANGAGKWVDLRQFDKAKWNKLQADLDWGDGLASYNPNNNNSFLDDGTWPTMYAPGQRHEPTGGVWSDLDRAP